MSNDTNDILYTEFDLEEARAMAYDEGFYDGETEARDFAPEPPPDLPEIARRAGFDILGGIIVRYDAASKDVVIQDLLMLRELRIPYDRGPFG